MMVTSYLALHTVARSIVTEPGILFIFMFGLLLTDATIMTVWICKS